MSVNAPVKLTMKDYKSELHNDWCAGCGDFGILTSIQMALAQQQLDPDKVAVFSGIGCSGKTPHYINAYGFHTLHGRVRRAPGEHETDRARARRRRRRVRHRRRLLRRRGPP
jgi:hypothetical protein